MTPPTISSGAADHALVVSGINSETGVVTLSDPGTPSGNEEQVPLSVFMDAWSASNYQMLVTDDAVGGADHAAATAVVQGMEHIDPNSNSHTVDTRHQARRLAANRPRSWTPFWRQKQGC